jgi:hypothetical protein
VEKKMSKLYFAKMNISGHQIYEVYDKKLNITKLLDSIFNNIDTTKSFIPDFVSEDNNSEITSNYLVKFMSIDKASDQTINGYLGEIKKEDELNVYDLENDDIATETLKNTVEYVSFYLDIQKEILAFTTTNHLSKKRVLEYFARLIKASSDIDVEFILETDLGEFNKKISSLARVSKFEIKLLPPNDAKEDFNKLFGGISVEDYKETDASFLKQSFSSMKKFGINMKSRLIEAYIKGVGLGYGEAKVTGKMEDGEQRQISSFDHSPFTKEVLDSKNRQLIKKQGKAGILTILVNKANIRNS